MTDSVCAAFAAINDEYQRRLIAANFQREPDPLCLYHSPTRVRAARLISDALRRSPAAVAVLLEATARKHWQMLRNQAAWRAAPLRALDQVLVWTCRDALQQQHPPPPPHPTYDYTAAIRAASSSSS